MLLENRFCFSSHFSSIQLPVILSNEMSLPSVKRFFHQGASEESSPLVLCDGDLNATN